MESVDHTGRGPRGYIISDEWLWENVCDALYRHPHIDARDMQVEVEGGLVILQGEVPDLRMRREAENCVYEVDGVRDVFNQLKLRRH